MELPTLKEVREELYEKALAKHDGHVMRAAREIDVNHVTIYRYLWNKGACNPQIDGAD